MSAAVQTKPTDADTYGIDSAAAQVARATAHVRQADAAVEHAQAAVQHITDLIRAKTEQRAEILARRHAGKGQPIDGGDLMLIQADAEDLTTELVEAQAALAAAQEPQAAARAMLAAAQQTLQRAEETAEEAALVSFLIAADATVGEALARLKVLHAALGRGRPAWSPTHDTLLELRRLRLAVGGLA